MHMLAFGMGAGCSPKAPGTMGTLLAVAVYLLLSRLPLPVYIAILIAVVLVGIWLCDKTARDLLTMVGAPAGWQWIVAGFLLFRLFDIWKPWPIGWLDRRVGGGLGIMLDDLLAGLFAALCLQGVVHWL